MFPLSHDLAKSASLAIFRRLRHAQQTLTHARERLATCQASHPGQAQMQQAQAVVAAREAEVQRWQGVRSTYRTHLSNLSLIVHPWGLVDSTHHTSQEVERQRHAEVAALAMVLETQGLPVKRTTLEKVCKQRAGVSALVDLWWQRVGHDVEHMALTPRWTQWVDELLLPLMYWQDHLSRTRCLLQKTQIAQALKTMQEALYAAFKARHCSHGAHRA